MTLNEYKRVALVTGASSGLGKAFAKVLLAEGMTVYAVARRLEEMADLSELGAITLSMDIKTDEEIQSAVSQITRRHSGVDVLINNASIVMSSNSENTSLEEAHHQFEVNLFGLARLTQLLLPAMRSKGAGKIINISTIGDKLHTPPGSWYQATKQAVEGWSDSLRLELQGHNIDVVIIEPNLISTDFGDVVLAPILKRPVSDSSDKATYGIVSGSPLPKNASADTPQVMVNLILKAVRARKPKAQYFAGKNAKSMISIHNSCGEEVFGKIILATVK